MWVFYILLLVPIVIQHVSIKGYGNYEKRNRVAIAFFFVFLTILIGLRHESVGNDTGNYISYFESFSMMSWAEIQSISVETGFAYFNKIVSLFTKDYQVFFIITAVTITAMIYPTYKRIKSDASLTIVLYVTMSTFVMMFSGIRQMLAIGIGFIAYEFTRKKKIIPFIICAILAITFHTSAIMLIIMYPLFHAKITKKWLIVVVPVVAVISAYSKQIFTFLGLLLEEYTKYDASISETGAYMMLILFTMFAIFSFIIPKEANLDNEIIGLRNFLLFSLIVQMFAPLHTLAMRMNYYYIIFIPLLIPKIIEARSKRWGQVAILAKHVMTIVFLMYFFYNAYTGTSNLHVFPYHFFGRVFNENCSDKHHLRCWKYRKNLCLG